MSYNADKNFPEVDRVFAPSFYTPEQLEVIRANIGKNPLSALANVTPEDFDIHRHQFKDVYGKNNRVVDDAESQYQAAFQSARRDVELALRRFYDLSDMAESGIRQWCGKEHILEGIAKWEQRQALYFESKKSNRGIGHHPEMYEYRDGQPKFAGRGSDAHRPRRNDVVLFNEGASNFADFTQKLNQTPQPPEEDIPSSFRMTEDTVGCPICTYEQQFDPESDRDFHDKERAVMTHMRMVKNNEEAHKRSLELIQQGQ